MCKTNVAVLKAQVGFKDGRCSDTPQCVTTESDIRSPSFVRRSRYLQYTQPYSNWFYISSHLYSSLPLPLFDRACRRKDPHWRQWIWLHLVADLTPNNAVTTIQNHRIKVDDMPLAKTVNLGNTPINIICLKGTVTVLHSSHFQALRSLITSFHSTWHTVRNLPAAQAKDFQVMCHHGRIWPAPRWLWQVSNGPP